MSENAMAMAPDVKEAFNDLKFSNAPGAALILKVDTDQETIMIDTYEKETTPEELAEEMSDTTPRYIIYSYKLVRDDGRQQYTLNMIYFCPETCNDRLRMNYSRLTPFVSQQLGLTKIIELKDMELFTESWLKSVVA
eukprot:JP446539.1.p1 GENE.JP446539.1~~JP446539.1.p1  ORF type:complete len:147 (+),score=44.56 JP446539.1:31-441(+)